jgi:protein-S-isoprenylcysteine O-methyltransferase Ste14
VATKLFEMVQNQKPSSVKLVLHSLITILFFPAIVLLASGDWHWLEGWVFSIWFVLMVLAVTIYLAVRNPALLAERSRLRFAENQKTWDKYVLIILYVLMSAWFIVMPLDARRFRWSPDFPAWLKVIGGLMLVPSLYLIFESTAENTFASTMVRIQKERKQRVIRTGVYGLVRHPMYLGAVLMMFGAPLLLGSLTGLIIAAIAFGVLVGRIVGEEKMLINELEGYSEYLKTVRSRLIPLVW